MEKVNPAWVLALLLVIAVGYIAHDFMGERKTQLTSEAFDDGYVQANQDLLLQIFNTMASCNTLPLRNGNLTVTLFAVECVQQQGGQNANR